MPSIADQLRAAGSALNPQNLGLTQQLFAAEMPREPYAGVAVERDRRYGPHERHRLDLFVPEGASGAPIVVFVHGGGFARGDKHIPNTPYFDNVALFATQGGAIGVTITYRLAPEHTWPAGAEDVAAAVAHLSAHAAALGGDPNRIFLIGTSAGAAHIASWLASQSPESQRIKGAVLMSGIYDLTLQDITPHAEIYFGAAPHSSRSSLQGLASARTPLFLTMAELDPPEFQRQTRALAMALQSQRGVAADLHVLQGHNHFSGALHLGGADQRLARLIRDFWLRCETPREP